MAKIAIMGHGTLGSGLAEVARINRESIMEKLGEEVYVKYILDIREFPDSPYADRFIKDFSIIENDPEVEVVVETIGGSKIAMDGPPAEVFTRAQELLDMGLDIPDITRVFLRLQQMGLAVEPVYTMEQALETVKKLKEGK